MERFLWCNVVLAVVFATGCGNSEPRVDVFPVSGSVIVAGQPSAGVKLQFHPSDATNQIFPRATTDESGAFQLGTYEPTDGVPPGDYVVTASWKQFDAGGEDVELHPDELSDVEEKLDLAVTDPATSPLKVTIVAGDNALEPFSISLAPADTGKKRKRR